MKAKSALLVFGALVGAIIVAIVLFLVTGPIKFDIRYFSQLWSAPESVRSMVFIEETDNSSSVVRIKFGGLEKKTFDTVRIVQVAQSNEVMLALVEDRTTGAVDIVRIEGKRLTPLTTDGVNKTGITLSPSGTHFAYAVTTNNTNSSTETSPAYRVADYETKVITLAGEEVLSFQGNHPFFLTDSLLVGLSEQGIITHDIAAGNKTSLQDDLAMLVEKRPSYGRNKTMVVQNPISQEYMVFEFITEEPPFAYHLVTVLPAELSPTFAFSEAQTMYYGVMTDDVFMLKAFDTLDTPALTLLELPASFFNPSHATFIYE